jgi:hypothetical protein
VNEERVQAGPHAVSVRLYGPSPSAPRGHYSMVCDSCFIPSGRVGGTPADVERWADDHGVGAVNVRRAVRRLEGLRLAADEDARYVEGRLF